MRKMLILALCLMALVPVAAQGDLPRFEEGPCLFPELDRVTCGTLFVPENRATGNNTPIELAVAILGAANGSPAADPVVYLEGGPGGASLLSVEEFLEHPININRDLILIDQRGAGFSQPSLNCWEMEEGESDDPVGDCYNRLVSEGIDLSGYNSVENAADINDLIVTLGYDEVNLWGISYGTRLALTVMRNHPERIRSVVIDSVFPPEINGAELSAEDSIRAFAYFFTACANDATCSAAYPDLEETFYEMIARFNDDPPVFVYFDGEEEFEIELYGDDILSSMFQTLYYSPAVAMLPYGITLLSESTDDFDFTDGYDIMQGFYTPESWEGFGVEDFPETVMESDSVLDYLDQVGDVSDSEGMFTSVTCVDEIGFEDEFGAYDAAEAAREEIVDWLLAAADAPFFDCETWVVDPAPAVENTRVESDIPTLLISGGFDPVTPPYWGDSALMGLPNGEHIVFPYGGHSESGSPGCAADIAAAYFDNPGGQLDTSCVPQSVEWYTE
jgi:pimeloyl-ACP methyl ester carboxylesterase